MLPGWAWAGKGLSATFGAGEANQTTVTPTSNLFDMFVASYLPDGTLAWVRHAGGDRDCRGNAIATFPDGSCAVAGFFDETATFGLGEAGQTDLSARGPFQDGFVARYHSDGTLAGVVRAGGRSNDQVLGVASQPDGGLFATGFFGNAAAFGPGEANQTILNTAGSDDIFLFHLKPMNYRMLEVQPR